MKASISLQIYPNPGALQDYFGFFLGCKIRFCVDCLFRYLTKTKHADKQPCVYASVL